MADYFEYMERRNEIDNTTIKVVTSIDKRVKKLEEENLELKEINTELMDAVMELAEIVGGDE